MIDTPPVVNEQIPRCRSPSFVHSSEPATFESPRRPAKSCVTVDPAGRQTRSTTPRSIQIPTV